MKLHTAALIGLMVTEAYGASSVSFTCPTQYSYFEGNQNTTLQMTVRYEPTAVDIGHPGLIWVALAPPSNVDSIPPVFFNLNGAWMSWGGGLFEPAGRFDTGLPPSFIVTSIVTSAIADQYVGWSVYAGHGILTERNRQILAARRTYLESQRAKRIAAGTWQAAYDNDDMAAWALVQKDADDGEKYGQLATVPTVSSVCNPMPWWWGGN